MPPTEDKWIPERYFDALHGDLKSLNDKVQRIEVSLAEMSGKELGQRLEKHGIKIEALEVFKNKIIGALVIINCIWGIVAAYVIWKLTSS